MLDSNLNNQSELKQLETASAQKNDESTSQKVSFFKKNSKKIGIILGVFVLAIIGYVLFDAFYDYTDIAWKNTDDGRLQSTFTGARLKLEVEASDRYGEKISKVEFEADDGKIVADDMSVQWSLPNKPGEYQISAKAPSGKKVIKKIAVFEDPNKELYGLEEKKVDVTKMVIDTDGDGINDTDEENVTKTDKNKADTDGDGLDDGNEIYFGLDPNHQQSKKDGIKDGKRELEYSLKKINIEMVVKGKKNVAYSDVDLIDGAFAELPGVKTGLYILKVAGDDAKAKVKIKYDARLTGDLAVFSVNDKELSFKKLDSEIDKATRSINIEVGNSTNFLIGDANMSLRPRIDVNILLDNSLSMYSNKQVREKIKKTSGNLNYDYDANDVSFKRVDASIDLIDKLQGDYYFNVGHFAGKYQNLSDFSNNKQDLKQKIESIKYNPPNDEKGVIGGTNIVDSINKALDSFPGKDNFKFVILLTDGDDTTRSMNDLWAESVIAKANKSKIVICSIGLGNASKKESLLKKISSSTGCDHYRAADDRFLENVFTRIASKASLNLIHKTDNRAGGGSAQSVSGGTSMLMADSGFDPSKDGFGIRNYSTTKAKSGNCFGLSVFANLYYRKKLPMSAGPAKISNLFHSGESKSGYDLSDTVFKNFKLDINKFRFTSKALTYGIYSIDQRRPADFWTNEPDKNGLVTINKQYRDVMTDANFEIENIKAKKDSYMNGKKYHSFESPLVAVDDDAKNSDYTLDERSFLNAVWRLHIMQHDKRISTHHFSSPDSKSTFEKMTTMLKAKNPVVVSLGKHAIIAMHLVKDLYDPHKFKIAVYDNNYPNETRYIDVRKNKNNFLSAWWKQEDYSYKLSYNGEDLEIGSGVYDIDSIEIK